MRPLTDRLLLSWLTIVALIAFAMVAALTPEAVSISSLTFASSPLTVRGVLLAGGTTLAIQTVDAVRAQLAADMVFLVAYGVLLRTSVRTLPGVPARTLFVAAANVVMVADAVENVFALAIVRAVGDIAGDPPAWWFTAMRTASGLKWGLAGLVLLALAIGWWREAGSETVQTAWRRWASRVIAVAFGSGGLASVTMVAGLFYQGLPDWIGLVALVSPALALLLQFRLLDTSALMVRFLYLVRVPFVLLVILAALGPLALGPLADLLGGLLVATTLSGVAVTSAATVALVFACVTQIGLVRTYAAMRVQDPSLGVLNEDILARCAFWTGNVAGLSLLFSVSVASPGALLANWQVFAGGALGSAAALLLLWPVEWIAARILHLPPGAPLPEFPLPFRLIGVAKPLEAAARAPEPAWKRHFTGRLVARLLGRGSGYIQLVPNDGGGPPIPRILPGHIYATIQFFVTAVVFWGVLELKAMSPASSAYKATAALNEMGWQVPTITSILLLLLLLGWALSGVAFFVDRYRTPLFIVPLVVAGLTGARACTDYTVQVPGGTGTYELATPGQVLKAFGRDPVVVAAAGGGIQAGAWTARVLRGIDDNVPGGIRGRVAAVSSVSGGSMGALYYGAYLREPTLKDAVQQALKPSLDEVATSLVSRDIFGVVGVRFGRDRGLALEESWEQRLPETERGSATMRGWAERTRAFARGTSQTPFPAFLFNSTIVESGQPVAFATTQMPTHRYRGRFDAAARQYPAVECANRILRLTTSDDGTALDVGFKAVTAARLSAAFPYISPAATIALENTESFHFVDGGYYDNHGLVALSQWLDDALEESAATPGASLPQTIRVVIVRGLASADSALVKRLRDTDPTMPDPDRSITRQGWRWQLTAPPSTALHVRTFGQWAGDVQVLTLLQNKWAPRGVQIVPLIFDYPGKDATPACQSAPLSWKLTTTQQACIETAWSTFTADSESPLSKLQ